MCPPKLLVRLSLGDSFRYSNIIAGAAQNAIRESVYKLSKKRLHHKGESWAWGARASERLKKSNFGLLSTM
jgi:hypothetical protein